MRTIRITARGLVPSAVLLLAVLLALFVLPRVVARDLPAHEAESLIRLTFGREVSAGYLSRVKEPGFAVDSTFSSSWAAQLREVNETKFTSMRIRRALIMPPFAWRQAFLVRVARAGDPTPHYFRIRRSIATRVPAIWWYVPL